jgi:hypothetical protein
VITADQLLCHAVGDYVLQTHWMATEKTRSHVAAGLHALVYTLPFVSQTWSPAALAVILVTHFFIDRYRLARFVNWAKNGASGPVTATGYPEDTPPWLAVWLLIITDNIIHVAINGAAIRWLA